MGPFSIYATSDLMSSGLLLVYSNPAMPRESLLPWGLHICCLFARCTLIISVRTKVETLSTVICCTLASVY